MARAWASAAATAATAVLLIMVADLGEAGHHILPVSHLSSQRTTDSVVRISPGGTAENHPLGISNAGVEFIFAALMTVDYDCSSEAPTTARLYLEQGVGRVLR